jgi:hypothetical protein
VPVANRNSYPSIIHSITEFMKSPLPIILSSLASITLLVSPLSALEPSVPDFSNGMPDATLEKTEKRAEHETFHLGTALGSREFFATLEKFLGPGWGTRTLSQEEMLLAATSGRSSNAEVNLAAYENAQVPGVAIRVIHLKPKEENADSSVEITVMREHKNQ